MADHKQVTELTDAALAMLTTVAEGLDGPGAGSRRAEGHAAVHSLAQLAGMLSIAAALAAGAEASDRVARALSAHQASAELRADAAERSRYGEATAATAYHFIIGVLLLLCTAMGLGMLRLMAVG